MEAFWVILAAGCLAGQEGSPPQSPPAGPPEEPAESAPPAVHENFTGRGLLDLQDLFPLAVLHLQIPINTLEVLKKGHGTLDVNFNWANSFALAQDILVDAETYRMEVGGWYALRDDFYLGAAVPVLARSGGILDGFVNGFHDAFRFGDGGRSLRPSNRYAIAVTEEGGRVHELESGIGLGDLVLKTHWNLNGGDRWLPAVSLQGLLGIPTSMPGFGADGLDLGLATSFHKAVWNGFHLHGSLGASVFTDRRSSGIPYEKVVYQGAAGIEYAVLRSFSLVFQMMSYGPLLESPSPLDSRRFYLAWGFKWEFVRGMELELSAVENIAPFENSADVSFATGFSFKF